MISKATDSAAAERHPPPQDLINFEGDLGDYGEGIDSGAYAMPFLALLQGLSPQVQRGNAGYVSGAAPGMILNVVTGELFDPERDALRVTVVRRTHTLCWWTPRDKGGGWLGEIEAEVHALQRFNALVPDEKKRRIDAEGHEWTEHRNFFCQLIRGDNAREPVILSLTKSQLKVAREWNSLIAIHCARVGPEKEPALTSEIWTLGSRLRTKGENSWHMWTVKHAGRHTVPAVYNDVRAAIPAAREMKLLARPMDEAAEETPGDGGGEM